MLAFDTLCQRHIFVKHVIMIWCFKTHNDDVTDLLLLIFFPQTMTRFQGKKRLFTSITIIHCDLDLGDWSTFGTLCLFAFIHFFIDFLNILKCFKSQVRSPQQTSARMWKLSPASSCEPPKDDIKKKYIIAIVNCKWEISYKISCLPI